MWGLNQPSTQAQFGELVGISQQAVSELLAKKIIAPDADAIAWLRSYVTHLREQAAGRGADGVLATERGRLAREQADAQAMKNAVARKELAPVFLLEEVLARVGRQIAGKLEAIPVNLRRRYPDLTGPQLAAIEAEIIDARNIASTVSLDSPDPDADDADASESDQ